MKKHLVLQYISVAVAIISCMFGFLVLTGVVYDGYTNRIPAVILLFTVSFITILIAIRYDR